MKTNGKRLAANADGGWDVLREAFRRTAKQKLRAARKQADKAARDLLALSPDAGSGEVARSADRMVRAAGQVWARALRLQEASDLPQPGRSARR